MVVAGPRSSSSSGGGSSDAYVFKCTLQNYYNIHTRTQDMLFTHSWSDDSHCSAATFYRDSRLYACHSSSVGS